MKMKKFWIAAVASATFFIAPAPVLAQWQVPQYSFPIGRGSGTGFDSVLCTQAQIAIGQNAAKPICAALSGDVTMNASGVTAIGAAKVTSAMLRNSAALSVIGRSANSTGVPADISCSAGSDAVLRESGSTLGCGTIATAGIANNAVTLAKLATQAANTTLANATSGAAVPTAFAMPSCSTSASALNWTTNSGFGCNTAISVAIANVTGLGTGVGTFLATPSSANLRSALTDETGNGAAVFADSPALSGTPTTTTASPGNNSTRIASTAYVDTAVAAVTGVTSFNGATGAIQLTVQPQGRLTLTSATPVTTSDVTGATHLYYTPYAGRYVPVYDGTNFVAVDFAAEFDITLGSNWATNTNYDWFVGYDSGTLRLCSGPAWSSDTSRGTGAGTTELDFFAGIYLNKVSITCRYNNTTTFTCAADRCTYLGSMRTVAAGQAEDSLVKRYLYNAYNQVRRPMLRQEATASWTYSTASYRQANAASANQLSYFAGLAGSSLYVYAQCIPLNSTSTLRIVYCGIGLDSTTVNSRSISDFARIGDTTVVSSAPKALFDGFASLGKHDVVWLEKGAGTDTQTWFGVSGSDYQSGISGNISQ